MAKKKRTLAQMLPRKDGWKPLRCGMAERYRSFTNEAGGVEFWPSTRACSGILVEGSLVIAQNIKQASSDACFRAMCQAYHAWRELRADGD